MSGTKIMKCKCVHTFQDKTYGKGNRVHNVKQRDSKIQYRCTVCGNVREEGKDERHK